jgi:deoxyribodipyrimidine photo-lyase
MFDVSATDPRVRVRRPGPPDPDGTCVVYWMQRAQRAFDNPALDTAINLANVLGKPVAVFFGLNPFVGSANLRHYHFLAEGLADIEDGLRQRGVAFVLRRFPDHRLPAFVDEVRPAIVIGDENPLKQMEGWRRTIADALRVPFWTVDADVVVPSRLLEKEQFAARTIRPRIHQRLPEFLKPGRDVRARVAWPDGTAPATRPATLDILDGLPIDRSLGPVSTMRGGTSEARRHLAAFVRGALRGYADARNHPELDGTSRLSPYLHFGHIGPREVALAVRDSGGPAESVAALLEQLIVRRELAVNFVTFNPRYDELAGCEPWALRTLDAHRGDARNYRYSVAEFEAGATHDPLWNAAQQQMVQTGWMHGYVRMYWAKKILEWTATPEEAFDIAILLNDQYELDGRDPNGYTNIAWALGGKHDRPWFERPVFGTIRWMSFDSTGRKFDSKAYIARWAPARGQAGLFEA